MNAGRAIHSVIPLVHVSDPDPYTSDALSPSFPPSHSLVQLGTPRNGPMKKMDKHNYNNSSDRRLSNRT